MRSRARGGRVGSWIRHVFVKDYGYDVILRSVHGPSSVADEALPPYFNSLLSLSLLFTLAYSYLSVFTLNVLGFVTIDHPQSASAFTNLWRHHPNPPNPHILPFLRTMSTTSQEKVSKVSVKIMIATDTNRISPRLIEAHLLPSPASPRSHLDRHGHSLGPGESLSPRGQDLTHLSLLHHTNPRIPTLHLSIIGFHPDGMMTRTMSSPSLSHPH